MRTAACNGGAATRAVAIRWLNGRSHARHGAELDGFRIARAGDGPVSDERHRDNHPEKHFCRFLVNPLHKSPKPSESPDTT